MNSAVSSSVRPAETVEDLYEFRQPEEVRLFLTTHPFLPPLLAEARDKIREQFPASRVFLHVVHDPEDPTNSQLIAFIATDADPVTAFAKLQALDANWWLTAMDRAQGKFQITLEPV
jgi:hypothetical protein